jgi:hypothetical protein
MSEFELQQSIERLDSHHYILNIFADRLRTAADTLERASKHMETASTSLEAALLYAMQQDKFPPPSSNGNGKHT